MLHLKTIFSKLHVIKGVYYSLCAVQNTDLDHTLMFITYFYHLSLVVVSLFYFYKNIRNINNVATWVYLFIEIVQKNAVQIIRKESRLSQTDLIFKELNISKINDIIYIASNY